MVAGSAGGNDQVDGATGASSAQLSERAVGRNLALAWAAEGRQQQQSPPQQREQQRDIVLPR